MFCEAPVTVACPVMVKVFVVVEPERNKVDVTKGLKVNEFKLTVCTFVIERDETIGLKTTSSPAPGTPAGSQFAPTFQSPPILGLAQVLTAASAELVNILRKNSKASLFIRVEPNIW